MCDKTSSGHRVATPASMMANHAAWTLAIGALVVSVLLLAVQFGIFRHLANLAEGQAPPAVQRFEVDPYIFTCVIVQNANPEAPVYKCTRSKI